MDRKSQISIITINLNNREDLNRTIQSVADQKWKNFEFIVIDGGSKDGSKELLQKLNNRIDYWASEPDRGIYNAMNKGLCKVTGEYVLFLNSGDTFCNNDVLTKTSKQLSGGKDIYYGDVYLIDNKTKELLELPAELTFSFFCISTITHQAAFIKRSLFDKYFYYNEVYKLVSDWEFFIYAICKKNCSYQHLNMPVCNYDINGLTSQKENIRLMSKERKEVLEKHFPLFIKDYQELFEARKKIGSPRIKAFSNLEQNRLAKRINSVMFKIFGK